MGIWIMVTPCLISLEKKILFPEKLLKKISMVERVHQPPPPCTVLSLLLLRYLWRKFVCLLKRRFSFPTNGTISGILKDQTMNYKLIYTFNYNKLPLL